jgi:hypothetical protein
MAVDESGIGCAIMRLSAVLFACAFCVLASTAQADSRVFIVANHADGYGIDQCLAKGESCGVPAARAYCQSRDFANATSFRRVERDEVTGAIPVADVEKCTGFGCGNYVAITCQR